jgi:hypothetical protein
MVYSAAPRPNGEVVVAWPIVGGDGLVGSIGGEATWADARLLVGRGRMVRRAELGRKKMGHPKLTGWGSNRK